MTQMKKTLRVTLDIEVVPADEADLEEAETTAEEALDETDPTELAEVVQGMFQKEYIREAFGGSNIYVIFEEEPSIVDAEWVDE